MRTPDRGKSKALRISLDYFQKSSPIDRARRLCIALGIMLSILYGAWILWPASPSSRAASRLHLSSGPLSQVHAAFEADCEKCHAHGLSAPLGKHSFQFEPAKRLDHQEAACKTCHPVDGHWRESLIDPSLDRDCANCHQEHVGRQTNLSRVDNQACIRCHRNLQAIQRTDVPATAASAVTDFSVNSHGLKSADGQIQFRSTLADSGRVKFDHAQHLRPGQIDSGRRGGMRLDMLPSLVRARYRTPGQADTDLVQLDCGSCHVLHALAPNRSHVVGSEEGRYYAPIEFDDHCQACHQLSFPGQTGEMLPLPHVASMAEYEMLLRARRPASQIHSQSDHALEAGASAPDSPAAVNSAIGMSLDALMQRCQQCHRPEDTRPEAIQLALKGEAKPLIPSRWLVYGYFDHAAHARIENCQFCHPIPGAQAHNNSSERLTQDRPQPPTDHQHVFIRGPESCVVCHRPSETKASLLDDPAQVQKLFGRTQQPTWASDDCSLCHRYHWTDPVSHARVKEGEL